MFCRHIYILVGGSRRGPVRRVIGTVLCFAFVYTWHGMWSNIFYWTLFNFVGIVAEAVGDRFVVHPFVRQLEVDFQCFVFVLYQIDVMG